MTVRPVVVHWLARTGAAIAAAVLVAPAVPAARSGPADRAASVEAAAPVGADQPVAAAQGEGGVQHVFATVTDKKGTAIKGLNVADFSVQEDGHQREILHVTESTAPMQIAVLADTSDPTVGQRPPCSSMNTQPAVAELRLALTGLIHTVFAANPTTEMALYTFGERPTLQVDYTSSPVALLRAADDLTVVHCSGAFLHEAIREACATLKKVPGTHPVIIAFVDERGEEFDNLDHVRVAEFLEAERASLWVVTLQAQFGSNDRSNQDFERTHVLDDVTAQSGGENVSVLNGPALAGALKTIASLLDESYDIAYTRPESIVPPKRVEVKLVGKSGLQLIAPHWSMR